MHQGNRSDIQFIMSAKGIQLALPNEHTPALFRVRSQECGTGVLRAREEAIFVDRFAGGLRSQHASTSMSTRPYRGLVPRSH